MKTEVLADHVVIRIGAGVPVGVFPEWLDGLWLDLSLASAGALTESPDPSRTAVCVPTGRFEVRGDGAVGEVYEVSL